MDNGDVRPDYIISDLWPLVVGIDEVQVDPSNAMTHDEVNLDQIAGSLNKHKQRKPIVINRATGTVEAGNGALIAARRLGWRYIAVVGEEDDAQTAVSYGIADNAVASDVWDWQRLKKHLDTFEEPQDVPGVDDELLTTLKEALAAEELNGKAGGDAPPQIDRAAELQGVWGTALGQIWQIGPHRLACGDCTDKKMVETVMGGERGDMIFTDPPYKGQLGGSPFPNDPDLKRRTEKMASSIKNLYDFDPSPFLKMLPYFCDIPASYFIFCNKILIPDYLNYAIENRMIFDILSWHKPNFIPMNNGKYFPDTEYIVKLKDKGALFKTGIPKEKVNYGTYWIIEMSGGIDGHPTTKPLEPCLDSILICSNKDDIICDPFLGSGTTMAAAHQLNRRCFGIEIDPGYTAVVLERMKNLGMETIKLIG